MAGHRREGADGLGGHRPGRHPGDRAQRPGGGGCDLEEGFHPLAGWCPNTRECLAMLLRAGNAGSNTFTDHRDVLAAAIGQVPARFRRKILVRVDGAGASHELVKHLLALSSPRRKTLFTCGWMITAAALRIRSRASLVAIQTDSLKSGHLSWSARLRVQRHRSR